ncbi:uncharacterized protein N7515_005170 [Penicillium bovifimosum]|uniref:SET domain-containing protein n=1 Tax=Penicillium bovifimosum TaxID=126998 RepID=A0A9W9GTJ0_9EURO|nr:uncharacterized protein N7515_005170 [Penicillium bovifimosum]KAJ5129131.1 hypothetical protein N7515_005170 [Penicillium bovifimosum]
MPDVSNEPATHTSPETALSETDQAGSILETAESLIKEPSTHTSPKTAQSEINQAGLIPETVESLTPELATHNSPENARREINPAGSIPETAESPLQATNRVMGSVPDQLESPAANSADRIHNLARLLTGQLQQNYGCCHTTEEDEVIAKVTYPIDRHSLPASFSPPLGYHLTPKLKSLLTQLRHIIDGTLERDHLTKLRHTLNEKLGRISGPAVTANIDCPKLLARLADSFKFVNSYEYRAGVERIPDDSEFNIGCPCNGNENGCDPSICDCLNIEEDSDDRIVPYQISENNAKLIVATKDFLRRKAIIYECNSRCGCSGDRYWNHGRSIKLEIFNTGSRGLGLRSPDFLHRGQYIDLYLGEVITKAEAEERENLTEGSHTQSYLFSVDWNIKDDEDEDRNMKVVDTRKFGSATRFINHSCNPNCKIVPVSTTNHADEYLYNLTFFANRDIAPGTELTFDYTQGEEHTTAAEVDPDTVPCLCGEANCRGQLWPNKRKGQGSKS